MVRKTDTIIIGAGQAGLATSRCLSDLGVDHVIFERGSVGQRWTAERWNSLRLLTPNWMTRLPEFSYSGAEPEGFMHKDSVAKFLTAYSHSFNAPVLTEIEVISLSQGPGCYEILTSAGVWHARAVVIATGACDTPNVPETASDLDADILQLDPKSYKSPQDAAPGGVLVVGASATGVQLADELVRAGRQVVLSVGSHVRVPRVYRGRDLMHWLDQAGVLAEPCAPGADVDAVVRHPSLQLVGGPAARDIDLNSLQDLGVTVVGRLRDLNDTQVSFENGLSEIVAASELREQRLILQIDDHIRISGIQAPDAVARENVRIGTPPEQIDLKARGISTVVWATGYQRDYSWMNLPVLSPGGEIRQQGGVTPLAGIFTMGLPFMRQRSSTFIDGVGRDATHIAQSVRQFLGQPQSRAA